MSAPAAGQREADAPARGGLLAGAGALVAAVAVLIAVALTQSHASTRNASGTGVPAGDTTTHVTRRTLTESATIDGTLGYGSTLELYDRLSGTYTWLPPVGALIARGGTLWRVDNLPVVLMYGSLPAYRKLKQGVSDGPDVVELNENLIDLGFDPYGAITDDEVFGAATAAAVRRWQKAEGLRETGRVELGRIVFAPGARRVTAVKVALGQDPPAKAQEKESKHPSAAGKGGEEEEGEGGGGSGAAMAVLSTTSTRQLVQLKLKAEQQTLARVGRSAPVTLPGGHVVRGRIIEVGSVASAPSSGEGEKEKGASGGSGGEGEAATIPVTLALEHPVAHLDEAPVSVELVKSIRRDVLAVPATALTATAGGGYAIATLRDGRRVIYLPVTPGMFAGGYVQVEGPGIHEGLTVIESE